VLDRGVAEPWNALQVSVTVKPIDGRWNIFAQTYASAWILNSRGKYVLADNGRIEIDKADLPFWSDATLSEVLFHELAHCFGFQDVIWHANGCLQNCWQEGFGFFHDGQYTGPAALAAYRDEYDAAAVFVPVEESHFAESMNPELLTPVLNGAYVSRTFLALLEDNGNTVMPGFRGGYLAGILPRRPMKGPVVMNF